MVTELPQNQLSMFVWELRRLAANYSPKKVKVARLQLAALVFSHVSFSAVRRAPERKPIGRRKCESMQ